MGIDKNLNNAVCHMKGIGIVKDGSHKSENIIFYSYYNRLKNIAISRYKWINLPPTVDPILLEKTLFEQGCGAFYRDKSSHTINFLPYAPHGSLNRLGIPQLITVYGINFEQNCTMLSSGIVFNNATQTSDVLPITMYAKKIMEIERTIDINVLQQRKPVIIRTSKNNELSLRNVYKKSMDNEPYVVVDNELDLAESLAVLDLNVKESFVNLSILKNNVWRDALGYLGIDNANTDKKERLNSQEVTSNSEELDNTKNTGLTCRQESCKHLERIFNREIWVELAYQKVGDIS